MAKKYVRVLTGESEGQVGVLHYEFRRSLKDILTGYPKVVQIEGLRNKYGFALLDAKDVKKISEKEYFKEKLRG